MTQSEVRSADNRVIILTTGESKAVKGIEGIPVQFEIEIDGDGGITTRYRVGDRSGDHPNLWIAYLLRNSFDRLSWMRKAPWSRYPGDHIGRPSGVALRGPLHPMPAYRQEPTWPWSEDTADCFLWSKSGFNPGATNDFCSLKPNIWWASLDTQKGKARVRAEANGDVAVRDSIQSGAVSFSIYTFWFYPDLAWGNYTGLGAPPAMTSRETKVWLTDEPEKNA